MATLCVAHTEPFLPRPRAAAFFAAFPPCALAFPGRSARRCMAPSYPKRPPHLAHPWAMQRCAAGSGSNSRSHPAAAGALRNLVAAAVRMLLEIMHLHAACPRTGLLARRAKLVERAWCKVAREAVGPEGHVVPQQWLVNTTAPGIAPDDRRRLDLVIYGAAPLGGALCCDATLVSPLAHDGEPHPGAAAQDGAVLRTAYRRKHATYPELATGGAQTLCVLGCEVGGRWNADAVKLVQRL